MSKLGRSVDMRRLAEAVSAPGIDPSCWVSLARVDDDDDALSWEPGTGWIVDVSLHGGKLDGVPITCRVASGFASSNEGASCPVNLGDEVVVVLTDGSPNDSPTIIARVANGGYAEVPGQIFDQLIDLAFARETHFLVTSKNLKLQVGSELRVDATDKAGVHAPAVTLADPEATQAYVRGTDFASALGTFLDGCGTFSSTCATVFDALATASVGPLAPLKTAFVSLATAFSTWGGNAFPAATPNGVVPAPFASSAAGTLKATLVPGQALSEQIKGE